MKKSMYNIYIFITIFILILFTFIYFKFFSFHIQVYNENDFKLKLPFYSIIYKTAKSEDDYVLTFKTLLSKSILSKKFNSILNEYEEYICQNQLFYYDKDNDITIEKIDIGSKKFINQYSITLSNGKIDNNFCSEVVDYKDLKYQIKQTFIKPHELKYKNTVDGNIYNIYYNLEDKDILLKTGMNKMNSLRGMLKYGWVSMNQFVDYIDYITSISDGSKIKNKEYVIYKTKDFSLLKCENNNIYIYESEYDYSNFVCK